MAEDTQYGPIPLLYRSRGLVAREATDRTPENTYLNLMNAQEREEEAMSSRYGTVIVNRDAVGVGTNNYPFSTAPVSLSRLTYLGSAWRYAATQDGFLWRRAGDTQGAYTGIYSGLSGTSFDSLVTNCFQSAQPYLFIADGDISIKDSGTGTPTLWGIDPPPNTANSVPYSPLLTLIDNFSSSNSYTDSGFSSGWSNAPIATIPAGTGQIVTDFPEFTNASSSISGGSAVAHQVGFGGSSTTTNLSGFPATSVPPGASVTLVVGVSGSWSFGIGFQSGIANISYNYSIDSGSTWTPFYNYTVGPTGAAGSFPPYTTTVSVSGLTTLSQLRVQIVATATNISHLGSPNMTVTGNVTQVSASINDAGLFGEVCNGILSNLNTNANTVYPIILVESVNPDANGVYQQLQITTSGSVFSSSSYISVYGTSNSLVDGFYIVQSTSGPNLMFVNYVSSVMISATGGTVNGGLSASDCVLVNQYSSPYPSQFSAWGFYRSVPVTATSFPIGCWTGSVNTDSTATVGVTSDFDLSINNQVTDSDLIVLTIQVGSPENISNIRLQFDVNSSGYTSSYYYKDISPAYYQGNIANEIGAYDSTQNQILADTLGLITGAPPNSTVAQLQPSNFSTGSGTWVAVYMRRGDFVPVGNAGQSGLDWTNITGWQVVFDTSTTGSSTVALNGLYLQWGYGPSSIGGVGYDYRYTYYNVSTGTESNGSPIQEFNSQYGYLSSLAAPFFLRQAVQLTGQYSSDLQVTHLRMYRKGGIYPDQWRQIDQVPNVSAEGSFIYKDVVPDASLAQANTLALDNDPPVTSSLISPILTALSAATSGPGNSIYSTFSTQLITSSDATANFVNDQIVLVGNAYNLEEVRVVSGGIGQFSAILRLQHNAGENVQVYSIPRQTCNLCALAYGQVWISGDDNNPGYLYFSKKGYPENFPPENYLNVSSPSDPINAVINWRGTLYVGTLTTWYIIQGGANPIAQPTGSKHGIVARNGWTQTESAIWYMSQDGLREFRGSEGAYMSLPIEWVFRDNPLTPLPLFDNSQASSVVMCYFNNDVYCSYVALDGKRYRLIYSTIYKRYRIDSLPMTAMLWEQDTNTFLGAYDPVAGNSIVRDQVYSQDYDDGGWFSGSLRVIPIPVTIQTPYQDMGKPHFPKQFNILESDVNTQGQTMSTTLLFDDGSTILNLPNTSSSTRQKIQLPINAGSGQQAYRMSLQHTMSVSNAPIWYQEDIYAAELAAYRYSFDSYWIGQGNNEFLLCKEGYFDYTSAVPLSFSLYADENPLPYFTFTLPAEPNRAIIRVRFPALKMRLFRMIGNVTMGNVGVQMWKEPSIRIKPCRELSGYAMKEIKS